MIFGSGTKIKQWLLGDGRTLLLKWRYSHLFWCPIAHHLQFFILSDKRSEDIEISKEEVLKLLPPDTKLLNIWEKYGGYMLIGAFVLIGIFS